GAELIAAAKDRDLFGRRRGLTADERALLRRLRASRRELRAAAVRLEREGGTPFFAFESHFADVLARGGFDLVAGNPPWVRGERAWHRCRRREMRSRRRCIPWCSSPRGPSRRAASRSLRASGRGAPHP